MAQDRTRKLEAAGPGAPAFLTQFSVTLVVVGGGAEGTEYPVEQPRTVLGRGSEADWTLDDDSVSKLHAAIEVGAQAVRVVDLGSTNGTCVNDQRVPRAELKHGDRVKLGEYVFQCLIEPRARGPRTFQID
jgi:pSer/pThr/pTyr-binding forkhead associated (FHA) protein